MIACKFEILNPKHETNPNFKFSNVQNKVNKNNVVFWSCETGVPPAGWGVRRTNFDIRISDLFYTVYSVQKMISKRE